MAEDKDTEFRVTDRRKFNPDGSPRYQTDEVETPAPPTGPEPAPAPQPLADNVVSFPGDAARKREAETPPAAPFAAQPTAAADSPLVSPTASPTAPPTESDDARAAQAKATASAAEQAYYQSRGPQSPHLPEASFLTLIDMFAAEAAMNLGMAQTPDGNRMPVDFEAARHWIDMLGMLDEKSRGNLTEEEAGVLENVLAYLRMQFVGASRKR